MLKKVIPALLTALLLWLAWPENGFTPLLFVAFIPLLLLDRHLSGENTRKENWQWFWYCWLCFGTWNLLGTWWLGNAHWSAVATTVIVNGLLMAMVMVIFRWVKNRLGGQRGYIALPFLWISFESLHRDWDLSFPWLTLGNGLAENVSWIQWYEYTGVFGGTLWIWLANLFLFQTIVYYQEKRNTSTALWRLAVILLIVILLPVFLSEKIYENYREKGKPVNVVVVQPNIDVYGNGPEDEGERSLQKFVSLASPLLDSSVDFLVGPEAFLSGGLWENNIDRSPEIRKLKDLCRNFLPMEIVIGASTLRFYKEQYASSTARPLPNGGGYYDFYNSALFIGAGRETEIYHKSKLVAGVEMMPFAGIIEPLFSSLINDAGGIAGSLGTQDKRTNFYSARNDIKIAPSICWESDFGEYTARHVSNGANIIFLITNDDWWGDTQGHRQHLHYARLRAIENRRSIARSANTGISCFINQRGDIAERTSYKTNAAIKREIKANSELTYYSKTGDLISRLSFFMGGFFILYSLVHGILRKGE